MAALVVPSFVSMLATSELRAGARDLRSQLLFARDLAVRQATHTRLVIDEIEGTSRVMVLAPTEVAEDDHDREWQEVVDQLGAERWLPEGISFARVIATDDSAEPQVTFSPDGRGQEFYVALSGPGDRRLAIHVDAVTGQPKVLDPDEAEEMERLELAGGTP